MYVYVYTCACKGVCVCGSQQRHFAREFVHTCNALQCVAVCCSVLQRVAVCCSVLQCVCVDHNKGTSRGSSCIVAVCCSVLQCIAVCCSVLQRVAACCSVLQCVSVCSSVCVSITKNAPRAGVRA